MKAKFFSFFELQELKNKDKIACVASKLDDMNYPMSSEKLLTFSAELESEIRCYFACTFEQIVNLMMEYKGYALNFHELPQGAVKLFADFDDFDCAPEKIVVDLLTCLPKIIKEFLQKNYAKSSEKFDENDFRGHFITSCKGNKKSLHFVSDELVFEDKQTQKEFWRYFQNKVNFPGLDMKVYDKNHSLRTIFSAKRSEPDRICVPITDHTLLQNWQNPSHIFYDSPYYEKFACDLHFEPYFISLINDCEIFLGVTDEIAKKYSDQNKRERERREYFEKEFEMPKMFVETNENNIEIFLKLLSLIDKKHFEHNSFMSWKILIHSARYYVGTVWAKILMGWFFSKTKWNSPKYFKETEEHIDFTWRTYKGDFNSLLIHFNIYHEFYLDGYEDLFEIKQINERYISPEHLDLDKNRIIILKSDTNTGKSYAQRTINKDKKVCEISIRIIQSYDIRKNYENIDHYLEVTAKDFTGSKNFVCQLESTGKFVEKLLNNYEYFILDEIEGIFDQLENVKPILRNKTFNFLERIINRKKCLLMSANVCERTYQFIKEFQLREKPLLLINNFKNKENYTLKIVPHHKFNEEIKKCVRNGEKVLAGMNKLGNKISEETKKTKEGASLLHAELKNEFPAKKHLLIASTEENSENFKDINKTVDEFDTITFTPKMDAGVDINKARVDRVGIFIETGSSNFITSVQMLARARNPTKKEVIISIPRECNFISVNEKVIKDHIAITNKTRKGLDEFLVTEYDPDTDSEKLSGSPLHRFFSWSVIWKHAQQGQIGSRFLAEMRYAGAKFYYSDFEKETENSVAHKKIIKQKVFSESVERAFEPKSQVDNFVNSVITKHEKTKEIVIKEAVAFGTVQKFAEALVSRDFVAEYVKHLKAQTKAREILKTIKPELKEKLEKSYGKINVKTLAEIELKYEFDAACKYASENFASEECVYPLAAKKFIPKSVLLESSERNRELAIAPVIFFFYDIEFRGEELLNNLKKFLSVKNRFNNMKAIFCDIRSTLTLEKVQNATNLKGILGFLNSSLKFIGYEFQHVGGYNASFKTKIYKLVLFEN